MNRSTVRSLFFPICAIAVTLSITACSTGGSTGNRVELGPTVSEDGVQRTTASTVSSNPVAKTLEERIVNDGARRLSMAEVTEHLAGNTQQWANGGAYYNADGSLDFIWEGKGFNHFVWKAYKDGKVCITNPDGFTTSCSLYFDYQDTVWTVVTEVFGESQDFFGGPDTMLNGNKLDELQPWDPALSGN